MIRGEEIDIPSSRAAVSLTVEAAAALDTVDGHGKDISASGVEWCIRRSSILMHRVESGAGPGFLKLETEGLGPQG